MVDNIFSTSRSLQEKVSLKIQDGIVIINTLKLTVIVTVVLKSKGTSIEGENYMCILYLNFYT